MIHAHFNKNVQVPFVKVVIIQIMLLKLFSYKHSLFVPMLVKAVTRKDVLRRNNASIFY